MAIVARLLLLLSVLLMPLGMGSAAASGPPLSHHAIIAGPSMEHCPDQSNRHERNEGMALCSMVCASALPAQDPARDDTCRRDHQLVAPTVGHVLTSIQPEIATPPPKAS